MLISKPLHWFKEIKAEYMLKLKITGTQPRVGIGAIIINPENKILMCYRSKGPEKYKGKLHLFGGKLELGETMRSGIIREVLEETGINAEAQDNQIVAAGMAEEIEPDCNCLDELTNQTRIYHWVSSVWIIKTQNNDFQNMEPDKHERMGWYDLNDEKVIKDLAPSASKSLIAAGLLKQEQLSVA